MKNYLEHDEKVRFVDGLLAHSQEWQWFIDLLNKTFDIHEVKAWDEYEKLSRSIQDVFDYFIKI